MEKLLILCGPSGSGKTAVMDELHRQYGLREAASITDRPQRYPGELGHVFLSKQEFDILERTTPLLLPTTFAGYRYAQTKDILDHSDILVLDPSGVQDIRMEYQARPVLVVGITAPNEILAARMRKRGDSEESVKRRIDHDEAVFCDLANICDMVMDDVDIKDAVSIIYSLLTKGGKAHERESNP